MSNVSEKPTPAQANMLKLMSDPNFIVTTSSNWRGKIVSVVGYYKGKVGIKKLNLITFRSLMDHKWISADMQVTALGEMSLSHLRPEDFIIQKPDHTAIDLLAVLQTHYPSDQWVFFRELRAGSGYGKDAEQRIDAWTMNCWPSSRFLRISFEVKVYRSDFLKELASPGKREFAMSVSNKFYFVTPPRLIKLSEIPSGCGLIEINDDKIKVNLDAPFRETDGLSWRFVASMARRLE